MASPRLRRPISASRSISCRSPKPPRSRACRRRPRATTRSPIRKPRRRGAATCSGRCSKLNYIDAAHRAARGAGAGRGARSRHPSTTSRRRTSPRWRAPRWSAASATMRSTQGYKVYTTIDGRLQTAANRAVRIGLIEYDRRHGYRGPLRAGQRSMQRASARAARCALADVPDDRRSAAGAGGVGGAARAARVYIRGAGLRADRLGRPVLGARRLSDTRTGAPPQARRRRACSAAMWSMSSPTATAPRSWRSCPRRRARWWRSIRTTAPSRRWWAASTTSTTSSIARRRRAASRAPASSRSCTPPRSRTASRPRRIVMDAPIVYDDSGQEKIWRPENNEKGFDGPTRLREALVHSRNLVTIRVVRQLGVDTAIDYAAKFGFNPRRHAQGHDHRARQPAGDAAADGRARYAVFANGGYRDRLRTSSIASRMPRARSSIRPRRRSSVSSCDADAGGPGDRGAAAQRRGCGRPRGDRRAVPPEAGRCRPARGSGGDPDRRAGGLRCRR